MRVPKGKLEYAEWEGEASCVHLGRDLLPAICLLCSAQRGRQRYQVAQLMIHLQAYSCT